MVPKTFVLIMAQVNAMTAIFVLDYLDRLNDASQKCEAVLRRARIQGSWSCVSLNSGLERNKEEEEKQAWRRHPGPDS